MTTQTQYQNFSFQWDEEPSYAPLAAIETTTAERVMDDVLPEERISEVILPSLGFSMAALVSPMLTQLSRSHNPRWLTLICTHAQAREISHWLKTTGVVINKLLLLTEEDDAACLQLGRKVLSAGNSHTVVCWANTMNPENLHQLERAARSSNSAGVIIRQRRG